MIKVDEDIFWYEIGDMAYGAASPQFFDWLLDNRIPAEIIKLFSKYTPQGYIPVGSGTLFLEEDIIETNGEIFPNLISNGLLAVGAASNGDLMVIDYSKGGGIAGFIALESAVEADDPREFFEPLAPSIGRFLEYLNDEDGDPALNYSEAKKRKN